MFTCLGVWQVWVRHYDPSLKDLRTNFSQTGAKSTADAGTQGGLSLDPNGSPLDEDDSRSGSAEDPLSSTDALLKFHVPLSEAQVLGRNVRVRLVIFVLVTRFISFLGIFCLFECCACKNTDV